MFVVHARQAVLNGLSPKENREIPPLQYDVVRQLRADFPALTFVVNGGVRTLEDVLEHLQLFDGVMIGREAYQNPYLLALLHQAVVRSAVVAAVARGDRRALRSVRAATRLAEGHRLRAMVRHVQGLYAGLPRVRSWRRFLSEQRRGARRANADMLMRRAAHRAGCVAVELQLRRLRRARSSEVPLLGRRQVRGDGVGRDGLVQRLRHRSCASVSFIVWWTSK